MGDRRNLLGTSAVLVGLGSALISGTAVANADTGGTDGRQGDGPAASTSNADSSAPAAKPRRGGTRAAAATGPAPAATVNDDAPVVRGTRSRGKAAQADVVIPQVVPQVVPQQPETRNAAPAPAATEAPAAAVPIPGTASAVAQVQQDIVTPDPAAPALTTAASAPAAPAVTGRGRLVPTVAASAPAPVAAYAAASPAPVSAPAPAAAQILDALVGLGLLPSGAPAAVTPALAAWTGQLADAQPAAVVGASPAAGAPPDPMLPGLPTNGVTGVQVGHAKLEIPCGPNGYSANADWYIPTRPDGTVDAKAVIWLQHGFLATKDFYGKLATQLAQQTNSIVVAPTLKSLPSLFCPGCYLSGTEMQQAVASMFLGAETALNESAAAAGFKGTLPKNFVVSGHSAGGGLSYAVAADTVDNGAAADGRLKGVVTFDGVSLGTFDGSFTEQIQTLDTLDIPVYQIAAPAQLFNMFAATTNQLLAARPDTFDGVVLAGGSHVDSMLGTNPLIDGILQLVTRKSPAGNTAATYTLSAGWINDFYADATPQDPAYGFYPAANQQLIMGNAAALGLPSPALNQTTALGGLVKSVSDFFFNLVGIPPTPEVNTGSNGLSPLAEVTPPPDTNGVTGVKTGSSILTIPSGNGYDAPADWYYPTQADGSVKANGVIWLQHGFLGFKGWYSNLATRIARETNSIVVAPQIFWFDKAFSGEAAAEMFVGARSALNISANQAGYLGVLPEKFLLTGHSAGGNFATVAGAGTVDNGAAVNLLGVVMFDGVSFPDVFGPSIAKLDSLGIPDYQIAATPQSWNNWGQTTQELALLHPGQFIGTLIDDGSHTDSVGGDSLWGWLAAKASDILVKRSPDGAKDAVGTFATGWLNDIYAGLGPSDPQPKYGIYGDPNNGVYQPNRPIVMGLAGATVLPAPPPVDIVKYSGKWYEQGSVKQFFAIGLVNTTATYTPQTDGTITVENAGNYFRPTGPGVNIIGAAVSTNKPTNTQLNVGFGPRPPRDTVPGNYWIMDYDPGYKWVIVSDPTLRSGYILTRDQTISADEYDALVKRAQQLGVKGRITVTKQFPPSSGAAVAGPAAVPASVLI